MRSYTNVLPKVEAPNISVSEIAERGVSIEITTLSGKRIEIRPAKDLGENFYLLHFVAKRRIPEPVRVPERGWTRRDKESWALYSIREQSITERQPITLVTEGMPETFWVARFTVIEPKR